jgi:hypothetical protein
MRRLLAALVMECIVTRAAAGETILQGRMAASGPAGYAPIMATVPLDGAPPQSVNLRDWTTSAGTASAPWVTKDANLTPLGYFQASVGASAISLATIAGGAIPANARLVYIQPENGDIRLRDDGAAPTAALGRRIYAAVDWPYFGNLAGAQLIAVTGSVTVDVTFYQ